MRLVNIRIKHTKLSAQSAHRKSVRFGYTQSQHTSRLSRTEHSIPPYNREIGPPLNANERSPEP